MIRRSPLPPRTKPVRKVNPKRRQSEFARCYHSRERVRWVKAQPCAWCVARGRIRMCGESENAHTETGGMGRKAGYETILPLGRFHHQKYDRHEEPFNRLSTRMVVKWLAEKTERLWQESQSDKGSE